MYMDQCFTTCTCVTACMNKPLTTCLHEQLETEGSVIIFLLGSVEH